MGLRVKFFIKKNIKSHEAIILALPAFIASRVIYELSNRNIAGVKTMFRCFFSNHRFFILRKVFFKVLINFHLFIFLNFRLHESGFYDLAAMIDYIIAVTGKPSITYLGHSRGCAMAVILTSSRPEYNSKINLFLGLAPVIYSKYAKCPIYEFAGNRPTSLMRTASFEVWILTSGFFFRMNFWN